MSKGRTVAYCENCKRELCKPTHKETAESIANDHIQLRYHSTNEIHVVLVGVTVNEYKNLQNATRSKVY